MVSRRKRSTKQNTQGEWVILLSIRFSFVYIYVYVCAAVGDNNDDDEDGYDENGEEIVLERSSFYLLESVNGIRVKLAEYQTYRSSLMIGFGRQFVHKNQWLNISMLWFITAEYYLKHKFYVKSMQTQRRFSMEKQSLSE